ncbi:rhomboid family intramembrane serine protease [Thermobifida halotolerans]|uniref:Rhomboid family intramembrane serine protease n=1 Tax=Thermobifida halotolerans TaxID=483545 RepID=A0A399FVB9_9ACTN|nr:rhomboid family intramembrane serine protease [Thermobifida halotolerans]UOE18761.1 rhomboid family intramembrane serine protease [Thermobifida halotolerans]
MTQSRIRAALTVVVFTAAMWIFEFVDFFLLGGTLDLLFGLRSWVVSDLWSVFTAPFMHANLAHLGANTVPLLVLGSLVAFSGLSRFVWASIIIAVVSGAGVWLFSIPGALTVGASGLIFGYFGYLVLRGIVERRTIDIVIMICVVLFYGGLIFGVLPQGQGISWQAHLFGFLGGLLAAYFLPRRADRRRLPPENRGYGPYGPSQGYPGY